jgi:hypothetical protein
MAALTYLQLVNSVLRRLRENEVTAVTDNTYSKMVGEFVNDAKRQCEDAYTWNALNSSISISTTSGTSLYSLTGSGQRFKVTDVLDNTNKNIIRVTATTDMDLLNLLSPSQTGQPLYYNFEGVDANGDTQVRLYPVPNGVISITFNITQPTGLLSNSGDTVSIPTEPIIFNAVARAIAERGEDGGMASSEQYALFKQSLGDAIAIESGRYLEEDSWISN